MHHQLFVSFIFFAVAIIVLTPAIKPRRENTIKNMGSENVMLSDIWIILSETSSKSMGIPFSFDSHYSGGNNYLFPGEQFISDAFPLDNTLHGFTVTGNPNRAFLSVYDHNSFADVNA